MSTRSACDWLSVAPECAEHPMAAFELQAARAGSRAIAGVDEAGRGALAGPLVAAAVILSEPAPGVDDSKRLTAARRDELYEELMAGSHIIGVEAVEASVIDANGIQSANYLAMARALDHQDPQADFALVDGFTIRGCMMPQLRIVKGDQRSQSIAAASIIAKVTRDRIMINLHEAYPDYGFDRHKGYGTRDHMAAIEKHGPSPVHRRSFAPMAESLETLHLFRERDISA